jgi:NAD-dependent deacetylase
MNPAFRWWCPDSPLVIAPFIPLLSSLLYWLLWSAICGLLSPFLFGARRLYGETGSMERTKLVELLRASKHMLVFTGAGISTGSGIPDFRGPDGVWKRRQPVYYHDFMRSEAARVEHWDFKLEGWPAFREARPNATHKAIVRLEQAGKLQSVVTQNIDGLHARAGTPAERLVELHGTNCFVECQSCGRRSDPEAHFEHFRKTRRPPVCECGGLLKPATISFGQNLRNEDLERAEAFAKAADLAVALGSTLSVYPAANIPLLVASRGAPYVIINRGPTEHDDLPEVTLRLEGDVNELFPSAVAAALNG